MTTSLKQHEFKAQWVDDEHGPAVMLTQTDDGYCEPQTVLVHPWQLRAACEHFGILPSGDAPARRSLATSSRRLLTLNERIQDLRDYVARHSDHAHADLHVEMVMLNALGDLAQEWATEAEELAATSGGHEEAREGPKTGAGAEKSEGAAPHKGEPGKRAKEAAQPVLL